MFKKSKERELTKIERRVASIPTEELVTWAENALFTIGKGITHYRKDPDGLDEAILGAEALLAVTKEIKARNTNV